MQRAFGSILTQSVGDATELEFRLVSVVKGLDTSGHDSFLFTGSKTLNSFYFTD
jgi:hypothetical protein